MKKLLFNLILVVSIIDIVKGQQDSPNKYVSIGISANSLLNNDFNISPQASFTYNNFVILAGPVICETEIYDGLSYYLKGKKLYGGLLSFQIIPNKKTKYFDLYFVFNTAYYDFKKTVFSPSTYYTETTEIKALRPMIGYGFNFKVIYGLYITSNLSLGYSFEKQHYDDNTVKNTKSFWGQILFGLGYNFRFK